MDFRGKLPFKIILQILQNYLELQYSRNFSISEFYGRFKLDRTFTIFPIFKSFLINREDIYCLPLKNIVHLRFFRTLNLEDLPIKTLRTLNNQLVSLENIQLDIPGKKKELHQLENLEKLQLKTTIPLSKESKTIQTHEKVERQFGILEDLSEYLKNLKILRIENEYTKNKISIEEEKRKEKEHFDELNLTSGFTKEYFLNKAKQKTVQIENDLRLDKLKELEFIKVPTSLSFKFVPSLQKLTIRDSILNIFQLNSILSLHQNGELKSLKLFSCQFQNNCIFEFLFKLLDFHANSTNPLQLMLIGTPKSLKSTNKIIMEFQKQNPNKFVFRLLNIFVKERSHTPFRKFNTRIRGRGTRRSSKKRLLKYVLDFKT